jgi:hypothetical protein
MEKISKSSIVTILPCTLCCPLGWGGGTLGHAFVVEPVLLRVIQWVDQVGHKLVLFRNLNHRSCIFVAATVISCRENCEQLSASESLKSILNALVGTEDEFYFIVFEE